METEKGNNLALLRAALLSLIIILAACSSLSGASSDSGVGQATLDPANVGLVARVNGVGIPETAFNRELERRQAVANAASDVALARDVLENLIRQELINQGAASLGVEVTEADVQAEFDNLRSLSASDETWQSYLATNGYTEAEMLAAQRDVLFTQRVQAALMRAYAGNVEQVNARHIVVRTREEAEMVLDRLNNGESFESLAAAFSIDTITREIGGNLGWFARNELFYPNLEEIAFQLEPGQIAGPIATSLGYHVIQTLDKGLRPVEDARLPMLAENIFNQWLAEQYQQATVERYR